VFRRAWLSFVLAACGAEPAVTGAPQTVFEERAGPSSAAPTCAEGDGSGVCPQVNASPAAKQPDFMQAASVCRQAVLDEQSKCAVHWTQACDRALLAAAHRKSEKPARTGACYYHDRKTCPDCACEYYLKVGKIGFDGGTGCLGSLDDVTRELRRACAEQRCEP
jgi:hypothetical protein